MHDHGGDVVKFAGDAVLVLWEGSKKQLGLNVRCAARCVVEIQKNAASFPVDVDQNLHFRNHIGVCCGEIESEVFEAPTHANMQKLYHAVGGDALNEISEVVDMAKAGEVCLASCCAAYIEDVATFAEVCSSKRSYLTDGKLLHSLSLDEEQNAELDQHIENCMLERICRRNQRVEEDFIHSNVLRQLSHGGQDPTQIAQIRNLCVLFVAMTSAGSPVNWLMEVQAVLDRHRCPIVQIVGSHFILFHCLNKLTLAGLSRSTTTKGCTLSLPSTSTKLFRKPVCWV